jgi:DnaD/phage-associated family protein
MAIYRNVSLSFWEDNKVVDNFTYKDKYFLLYLLTNPHTNLIGCYEVSIRQMSNELELDKSEVEELLTRMEQVHKVILYAEETKEILIKNWHKYNWTKSEKLLKKVESLIQYIKSEKLRKELEKILERYRVSIGYPYPRYTSVSVSVSDSDLNINNNININNLDNITKLNNLDNKEELIFSNIFSTIEKNFGRTIAPLECDVIKSWVDNNISEELIVYATQIAVCNNACSVKYIDRILEDWQRKKITTLEQAKKANEKFKNKKESKTDEREKWENE